MERNQNSILKRADFLIVFGILAVGGIWYWMLCLQKQTTSGSEVVVTVNGDEYGRYDLNTEQVIRITSENDGFNELHIANGQAWIEKANCKNHYCMNQNAISDKLESIICIPHGVTVFVENKNEMPEYDVITK